MRFRMLHPFPFLVVGFCCLLSTNAFGDSISFSDETFADSDWTAPLFFFSDPDIAYSNQQEGSGGNPGAYREFSAVRTTPSPTSTFVRQAHLRNGAIFDPATEGAITSLSYTFDILSLPISGSGYVSFALGLLLYQNGAYYIAGGFGYTSTGWRRIQQSFTSSISFYRIAGSGPDHPDFSASGAPIRFGFFSQVFFATGGIGTKVGGIDNWSVTMNFTAPVPEPGTWWL
ncbi:MAG: hypothetical protein D6812_02265, partial [Deltaproteobacteria bacterium]